MLESGQDYSGYSIVKSLGNRRAIENYQARMRSTGALVRLTILNDELLPDQGARRDFISAAGQICALSHAGVARLLDVGETANRAYYVSEFYPGGNLKQALGKRQLPGQVLRLIRDIGQALEYLHAAGVCHGNLKPGNILQGQDGRPIVTDVGVSALIKLDYNQGVDPYYVSPEQVRGALPGPASDIYSLGIMFYQLLCGKLPFSADSDFRIAMLRLEESAPVLPAKYAFAQNLLDQMLAIDPLSRLSASELLSELEALVIEADTAEFDLQSFSENQQGELSMTDKPEDKPSDSLAAKIEETLVEREQQRLNEQPVSIEITDPEREGTGSSYFSYLMLLLGLLVGAVIGAAFYFVLPNPGNLPAERQQVEVPGDLRKADSLLAAGKYDQARKAYLEVIAQYPKAPRPYNNLASLYASEGDLEQAQALLKGALRTDSDYLAIYRNIGTVYAAMARDSYGKALQLSGEQKQIRLQVLGMKQPAIQIAKLSSSSTSIVAATVTKSENVSAPDPVVSITAKVAKPPAIKPVAVVVQPAVKGPVSAKVAPKSVATSDAKPKVAEQTISKVIKTPITSSVVEQKTTIVKTTSAVTTPVSDNVSAISDPSASLAPQQFLRQWANAWSTQNVAVYLASYAADYTPPGNQSLKAWQEKRRSRINLPASIEVNLGPVESISGTGEIAQIQLIQEYRSDRYQDRTRKSFTLRRNGQSWLIIEERSLGRIR